MKNTKRILFSIFCVIAVASCVSTKKYDAVVSDQQSWQQKYAGLQTGFDTLQNKNRDLQTQLKNEQDRLDSKERGFIEIISGNLYQFEKITGSRR